MSLFMKKRVKSYLVFTSFVYRIVMYVVMPVVLLGISLWIGSHLGEICLILVALLLILVEVVSDSWVFAGIQARDPERIDYLKSSGQGMRVMQNALSMDLVRKLLSSVGILMICYLAMQLSGNRTALNLWMNESDYSSFIDLKTEIETVLYLALVSYFFSVLGTFLSRYGSAVWLNLIIGYTAMTPALFCMFLPGHAVLLYNLLFAILGAGISIVAVKLAMRKMKGGYYDK